METVPRVPLRHQTNTMRYGFSAIFGVPRGRQEIWTRCLLWLDDAPKYSVAQFYSTTVASFLVVS